MKAYYSGTGCSRATGLVYGGTWAKGLLYGGKALNYGCKALKTAFQSTKSVGQTIKAVKSAVTRTPATKLFQKVHNLGASATKEGLKKIESIPELLIQETLQGKGYFASKYKPTVSEALEAGEKFLGRGYRSIGRSKDGVFKNADRLRQFRIDSNSLMGKHDPWIPHFHLETFKPENIYKPYTNNHIPFVE